MRNALFAILISAGLLSPAAEAQLSLNFSSPGVSIGVNVPVYPTLQRVPGYPVYYAPGVSSNYFFYDGLYWVYEGDNWYESTWYNGPWRVVDPGYVPVYLLRVPVRYYRRPPDYFRGWRGDAPPRWGEHWGRGWEERRGGWDHWDRRSAPAAAPLPSYQRGYSGNRYPQANDQHIVQSRSYRYQPNDAVAQQHFGYARSQAPVAQPQVRVQDQRQVQHGPDRGQPDRGQPARGQQGGERDRGHDQEHDRNDRNDRGRER